MTLTVTLLIAALIFVVAVSIQPLDMRALRVIWRRWRCSVGSGRHEAHALTLNIIVATCRHIQILARRVFFLAHILAIRVARFPAAFIGGWLTLPRPFTKQLSESFCCTAPSESSSAQNRRRSANRKPPIAIASVSARRLDCCPD
jgi:hypothetical protein